MTVLLRTKSDMHQPPKEVKGYDNESSMDLQQEARRLLKKGARLLREGKSTDAIDFLERADRLDPGNVPVLLTLGGAYIMAGRHRDAIRPLEAARDAEPQNAMLWINLGAAYLGNPVLATPDQQLKAIQAFEQALELDPAAPSTHYNIGLIRVDRGERELALEAFRKALQVNPLDSDARHWIGKLESHGRGTGQ
jgi:tetratricopeptide (TPR) repeat protein